MVLILIAAGGALGAVLRHLTNIGALRLLGAGFPFGTLAVNVIGSLVMGIAAAILVERSGSPKLMAFLMTGLLGGFTTFSAFSLDAARLYEAGRLGAAAGYAGLSVAAAFAALFLGLWIGRMLT